MKYENKRRLILGISVLLLIILYLFKSSSVLIRVAGVIFGLWIFYFLDHSFDIKFHRRHYVYMISVLILGVMLSPVYFVSPNYDKVLHFFMPILGCIIIFFVVNRLKIKLQWKLLITFTSIMTVIALHEIGEYLLDVLWNMKTQGVYIRDIADITGLTRLNLMQSRIDDTMMDMLFGFFGVITFAIGKTISYYCNKRKGKKRDLRNKIKSKFKRE